MFLGARGPSKGSLQEAVARLFKKQHLFLILLHRISYHWTFIADQFYILRHFAAKIVIGCLRSIEIDNYGDRTSLTYFFHCGAYKKCLPDDVAYDKIEELSEPIQAYHWRFGNKVEKLREPIQYKFSLVVLSILINHREFSGDRLLQLRVKEYKDGVVIGKL